MELEKFIWNSRAYETYKFCLSTEQTDVLDLFLTRGLQISEIAENKHTSRQSVSKNVKIALAKLAECENNLHFLAWQDRIKQELDVLENFANNQNLKAIQNKLKNLKKEL